MQQWLSERNSILFLTLTMPHDFGESCQALMETISRAFSSVFSGRPFKRDRQLFGIEHTFRAWDATHGVNGWHPHLHGALFVRGRLEHDGVRELEDSIFARWLRAVVARGHRPPTRDRGIHLEAAHRVENLAGYLLRVRGEESGTRLALELIRGDLKTVNGRSPFQILQAFADTGDLSELELFREWAKATKGRHFARWSDGARVALSVDQCEDQDLVEMTVGGVTVFRPNAQQWHALTGTPGALAEALRIAEEGGTAAVATYTNRVDRMWCTQRRATATPPWLGSQNTHRSGSALA